MFLRKIALLLLVLLTSLSIHAAGAGKLIDFLLSDSGVAEILTKNGVDAVAIPRVKRYVSNSLVALNFKNKKPTKRELQKILNSLGGSPQDIKVRQKLQALLNKTNPSKKDVVNAVNGLIYLANRHGHRGSTVLACAQCVSDVLSKNGFKFTLEEINNTAAKKVLDKTLPRKPRDLTNFINTKISKHNFGSLSKVDPRMLRPEEERALGLFLGLADSGSKKQKELIEAIREFSTDANGSTQLVDSRNPHTFWKLFSEDMDDDVLEGWTKIIREATESANGKTDKQEAFYAALKKRAGDDQYMNDQLEFLKKKSCFFK
jgi:sulfur carrier protein ThiS